MSTFTIDSRYELVGVIGKGGNAVVYQAIDRRQMRFVALKVLEGSAEACSKRLIATARLEREGRAVQAINHPNVCPVLECGTLDDGRPFVAMKLLKGETLRAYLRRVRKIDVETAIEIALQILAGLEAAHAQGVVHRDVKPENVFIEWYGNAPRVKLLDFGVCRRVEHPLDDRTLTLAGCVVGTPGYFAPEQAFGERALDPRVDLYAVGVVLYEMLTGHPAFPSRISSELAAALARKLPSIRQSDPTLPEPLARVVAGATEPKATRRYSSTGRFQHDLLEARTEIRHAAKRRSSATDDTLPSRTRFDQLFAT